MSVPMNYNSTGGDDADCSLNPTGDCTINVTAYAFMWEDRKGFLTEAENWNPPVSRQCAASSLVLCRDQQPPGTRSLHTRRFSSSAWATCKQPIALCTNLMRSSVTVSQDTDRGRTRPGPRGHAGQRRRACASCPRSSCLQSLLIDQFGLV
jgi:hypothetical protein